MAGKQPAPQWLDMDAAIKHCTAASASGSGPATTGAASPTWSWPAAGDVPTLETLAAVHCSASLPELKIRVVNVVDLMKLQPASEHPHGLSDKDFDVAVHQGQADHLRLPRLSWLIHRLTYRRTNHDNLHVRGYKEEGTTTTPFDMAVLNELDRFHLVNDVIDRLPQLGSRAAYVKQSLRDKLIDHKEYIRTARTCRRSATGSGPRIRRLGDRGTAGRHRRGQRLSRLGV